MFRYLLQMSPMVPPSASLTRLISMKEELKEDAGRKENADAAQEQLHVPHNATAATVPSCVSSKRKSNVLLHVVHFLGLGRIMWLTLCVEHLQAEEERGERGKVKTRGHIQIK